MHDRPNSGDFYHQIGQPLGGVEPADGAGVGGHRGQPRGLGGERGDFRRQPVGCEFGLRNPDRAIGLRQHAGIGELILVDRTRQRHQDRGPADRGEFGDRAGAGRETTRWLDASRAGRSMKNGASSALILSRS